jgi:hypothetical protein
MGNGAERASWSRQSADPVGPLPLGSHSARPAFLFGNWYARAYLLVVAAVAVLVALVLWIGARERKSPRRLISWKAATCWRSASGRPRQGRRVNPSSGEHDRVAAAIAPAIDH